MPNRVPKVGRVGEVSQAQADRKAGFALDWKVWPVWAINTQVKAGDVFGVAQVGGVGWVGFEQIKGQTHNKGAR